MSGDDAIRLRHMLDAAREVIAFTHSKTRGDLAQDRMLALALIKDIEIIGEAASRISPDTQQQYPSIRWAEIIGMRNHLIHAYFDIDFDQVWSTVADDLPALIAELETIIPPEDATSK